MISAKKRLRVYGRDGYKCKICGTNKNLSIDHITPKSKNGTDDESNLRTLCVKCNNERGSYNPTFFQGLFGFLLSKKEANVMRDELLGTAKSYATEVKRLMDIKIVGAENKLELRDNKVLDIVYLLSERMEAMEQFLEIEYIDTEVKGYVKK